MESRVTDDLRAAEQSLQTRACQVYWDIKILLDNHRTRGALARWRTLYEIAAVRLHIGRDESLATRYLDYIHIDQLRKMRLHNELLDKWKERLRERETQKGERHKPHTPQEMEAKQQRVDELTAGLGKEYGRFPWGWSGKGSVKEIVDTTELDFLYGWFVLAHDETHDKPFNPVLDPNLNIIAMSALCLLIAAAGRELDKNELVLFPGTLNLGNEEKRSVLHACEVCQGVLD